MKLPGAAFFLPLLLAGCAESASERARAFAAPQPYCTRTLGLAQCFANPGALPDHPSPLADTPARTPQPPPPLWRRLANDWRMED